MAFHLDNLIEEPECEPTSAVLLLKKTNCLRTCRASHARDGASGSGTESDGQAVCEVIEPQEPDRL